LEYHSEHLAVGMDTLAVNRTLERLESEMEIVILPSFYYGAGSYAVAPSERNGTVQVGGEALAPFAKDLFASLLKIGFRNIHGIVHHQSENFWQGMPTDLAFRFAARRVIFEWLEKEGGEGWWGTEQYSAYYSGANNPFAWIRIFPVRHREATRQRFAGDHAGQLETSEALVICPECVEMNRLDESLWYARPGKEASRELGDDALEAAAEDIETLLFQDRHS
jgi:creatinine amidohydrolase